MIDKRQSISVIIIAFRLFITSCYAAISTELVEEWGCYDSEFKLTCNDIDSKIGILESTFTPHCNSGNQKCLYYDEDSIMKIIAQSLSRKAETHEEEYAARKLLDVIRNARLKEREREENEARTEEYRAESPSSTDIYDPSTFNANAENLTIDWEMVSNNDKQAIRDSLERLINLYLTKLREDSDDFEDNHFRGKRDLNSNLKANRRKKLIPGDCKIMRRRIGTLDRIEIEQALRNLSNTEFNIRKLLNYRCSGKNHCSFIFSSDHPYSTFWDEGTIHIKYFCMENFRVNKYCGELLQVGNEDWDLRSNINWTEIINKNNEDDNDEESEFNGPRTEALRHDMNFYQVKSVKIIKPDDDDNKNKTLPTSPPPLVQTTMPKAKNSSEIKLSVFENDKDKPKNKVYSQDFRVMKILPNVVEKPAPDIIEKLKKEEYVFKKEKADEKNSVDSSIETNEIDSVILTTMKSQTLEKFLSTNFIAPTLDIFTAIASTKSSNQIDEQTTIAQKIKTEVAATQNNIVADDEDYDVTATEENIEQHVSSSTTTATTKMKHDDISETVAVNIFDSPEKGKYGLDIESDETEAIEKIDREYYDSEEEKENRKKQSNIVHKAMQHTLPSSTLLHGFIANPGYPSYYIGSERDCKWRIRIAKGQKMSLTILDLHLRIDDYCKDSLEIIDVESKKSLWKGCAEITRPLQIESISHQVEIVLKTKSKNIYPKRGFLIHYKAIGCIVPQIPENVKLVSRLENLLRFNCEPNHVHPDTSQSERTLICINEAWNDTLTKCVALHETFGRQINLVNEQLRREGSKMGSESDTLNDILVPIFIISGLFILNAIVFIIILRYRKQRRDENFDRELADL
ncbi:hypothetical protein PVAND_011118 [Polypedilum vanderplanki]|uniref:CUB domain-containing protein n=1 Tax=Polypedilum vanderplanki TaxID=319348 RepID=A0A9J6CI54_POLVA|nr:hypothetical protein PVAND_011118 [Polypedilum vanderplanki]